MLGVQKYLRIFTLHFLLRVENAPHPKAESLLTGRYTCSERKQGPLAASFRQNVDNHPLMRRIIFVLPGCRHQGADWVDSWEILLLAQRYFLSRATLYIKI
jgi:hypothetical protein